MVNYTEFGGNDGNDNDNNDDDVTLKVTPYAAVDFDMDSTFYVDGNWGESLAISANNAELVDGALYERTAINNKPDEGTFKVFGWASLGYTEDMDFSAEDAPKVNSETFGGKTYKYELVASRYDAEEDNEDFPTIGGIIMFEGGSEDNGPSSSAKSSARILTQMGRDAVLDEDDVYNWLDSGVSLRADLKDRRVRYYKVEKEGDEHNYYSPVFVDLVLDQQVTINNDGDDGTEEDAPVAQEEQEAPQEESEPEPEEEPEKEPETPEPVAVETDGGFTEQIQEFIGFCRDNDIQAGDAVKKTLTTMVSNPGSAVDEEMVGGREDEIVAAVQA